MLFYSVCTRLSLLDGNLGLQFTFLICISSFTPNRLDFLPFPSIVSLCPTISTRNIDNFKTPANGIHTPLTRVFILISIRLISTNFYAFICFAKFPFFMFQSYIPETMYFTGLPVIFNCPISMPFQLHPLNFILGENSFCFLKFPISDFSNLRDSHFPFWGYWG